MIDTYRDVSAVWRQLSSTPLPEGSASASAEKGLNVVSLFSGIGGFEIGLRRVGHETILLCECEPAAAAVLRHRFPGIALIDNVEDIKNLPDTPDVLCAGFPCQNLSMVGDKKGISGPKSSLVNEAFRLIRQSPPRWVIFENVMFMLHLNRGAAMWHMIRQLEDCNMNWAYRVVDTYWFGLPQRRRRVFLVASKDENVRDCLLSDDKADVLYSKPELTLAKPIGFYWTEGNSGVGLTADAVPPLKSGSALGIPSAPAVLFPDGTVETPTIQEAERLQGFPASWTEAADAVRTQLRWKLVGNAVPVPIAEWLGQRLLKALPYENASDRRLQADEPWPKAGWGGHGERFASAAGENPLGSPPPSLEEFALRPWRRVSDKALAGFYSRARKSSLKFTDGFLPAIASRLEDRQTLSSAIR